jgi:transcription termination factor Rho
VRVPAEAGEDHRPPRADVRDAPLADLHALAREQGVRRYRLLRREELVEAVSSDGAALEEPPEPASEVELRARPPEPLPDVDEADRAAFADLRIDRPDAVLRLERAPGDMTGRMIDLIAPIGRGQRGLVAGPPGAGASRLLRDLADALSGADAHVMAVLCDVRPEEMLDWEPVAGLELHAATAEEAPESQCRVAADALEQAKRLAEDGRDVVVLLDSATRLARAHTLSANGADAPDPEAPPDGAAVHAVKRWFASARNTRDAGSLTILAVVRTDSESRLDAAVYDSLADAANLELRLDAGLAEAGRYPALDLTRSRTLHEEGLIDEPARRRLELLRGVVRSLDVEEAWRFLAGKVEETRSNEELLAEQA